MLLDRALQPFIEQRPICVLARAALERLLDPQRLDALFERTAQTQYTHELLFSVLVELMSQVVLGFQPSVHAAYRACEGRLPVSDQAVYDKLRHVELPVAQALVQQSAQQVAPVLRQLRASLPSWLPGYRCKILDGSHLPATEHRLKVLRGTWAGPLPGHGLVVMDQPTRTVTDLVLTEDGQAQERALLHQILPRVQRGDVWLGDRQFCTLGFLAGLADRQAYFIIRQHGTVKGVPGGSRRPRGRCATGKVFEQQLRLRHPAGGFLTVRRITVLLDQPTRDGDTEIHILTNLPVRTAPAATVADLYRKRWTIEGLFGEIETMLACEVKTLAYPKAALFAFSLGLLAWNAVALLQGALRAAHGRSAVAAEWSGYYLALEMRQAYDGMMVVVPAARWAVCRESSDAEFAAALREVAEHARPAKYRKARRGPKKRPPPRARYRNGAHVATARLLAQRQAAA
jgi:hypothetical protein